MEMVEMLLASNGTQARPTANSQPRDTVSAPADPVPFDLDIGLALDLLARAVHTRGRDYLDQPVWLNGDEYLTCLYAHDGTARCIVGEVLLHAGVSIEALEAMGEEGIRDLYRSGRLPIKITLGALLVLQRAQRAQDQGYTWGEALRQATEAASILMGIVPTSVLDRATRVKFG